MSDKTVRFQFQGSTDAGLESPWTVYGQVRTSFVRTNELLGIATLYELGCSGKVPGHVRLD